MKTAVNDNTSGSDTATATGPLYRASIVIPQSAPAALRVHVQCKFCCVIDSVPYQDEMKSIIS